MTGNLNKIQKRLSLIGGHALHKLLPVCGQFLLSFLVIYYCSPQVWGQVVSYMIVVNLWVMCFNWGQNTFLIRGFGQKPTQVAQLWQQFFLSRTLLLGLAFFCFLFFYNNNLYLLFWLMLWLSAIFVFRSFDPVHLYVRKFNVPVLIEFFSILIILIFLLYKSNQITLVYIIQLYAILSSLKAISYCFYYRKLLLTKHYWKIDLKLFISAFPFFLPSMIGFVQSRIDLYGVAYYLPHKTLGEYQIFFKVIMLLILASRIVVEPFLKIIYRLPFDSLIKLSWRVFFLGIFISAPAITVFFFLLPVFYQINFSIYLYFAAFLMIVPFLGYIIPAHILIKYHREKQMAFLFFIAACCNVILNYFLIPHYQALGAICSTAIVQWLLLFAFSFLVKSISVNNK
jgi:O-antigen/teichoic acid export membrane protein